MRTDPKRLVRRLTPTATRMLEAAVGQAASARHAEVTVEHMLLQSLVVDGGEPGAIMNHFGRDRLATIGRLERMLGRAPTSSTSRPVFAPILFRWLEDAWLTASINQQALAIRSGTLFYEFVSNLARYTAEPLPEIEALSADQIASQMDDILARGKEALEAQPESDSGFTSESRAPGSSGALNGAGGGGLARYCVNLTEQVRTGDIDPIFGRHREIRQLINILCRRRKNNPLIVGEPGVGKTALVEGLAHEIVRLQVPDVLKNVEVYSLDLGLLQAGASVRGEFERRLRSVISEVKSSAVPIVLFVDEAHTLIGAGGKEGGGDAANLLKPALARGELRTIAATTWAEYKKYFEKDAALERRFQPVKVDEPSETDAAVMLRGVCPVYEEAHAVRILDEAITAAVNLSHRYITGRQLPDKAVDLLDTTAARVRVDGEAKPEALVLAEEQVASLRRQKEMLERDLADGHTGVREHFDEVSRELQECEARHRDLEASWEATQNAVRDHVDADAVAKTVSAWTGVPLGAMKRDLVSTVLNLREILGARVVGQEHAVSAVSKAVQAAHAGIQNPDGPVGVMLFVGPSGVGKTETAIALSDVLYGGERFLTTINMTEFMEKHSISRLIGSPPGYVGYGEGGVLTEAVRQRPYSVVLLDECEKADVEVMNLFYQVFDKGTLSDGEGRLVNFRNTMIVLTCNLASDVISQLYREADSLPTFEEVTQAIRPILSRHFKPALLARMTIVPYSPISPESLRTIAEHKLDALCARVEAAHGVRPTVHAPVIEELVRRCSVTEAGARTIDHVIRGSLSSVLSQRLLEVVAEQKRPSGVDIDCAASGGFDVRVDSSC